MRRFAWLWLRLVLAGMTLLLFVGLPLPGCCLGGELQRHFSRGSTTIEIQRTGVTLVRESDGASSTWSSSPWDVRDCAADTSGGVLYLILGSVGESGRSVPSARMAVLSVDGTRIEEALVDKDRGHNPWKIRAGDIDGDGRTEVCVGVSIQSGSGEPRRKCLHVYGWDGVGLFPRWLGTKLSMPFMDFELCDTDTDGLSELVSLETQKNGLARVMVYDWRGFGFEGKAELGSDLGWRTPALLDSLTEKNVGGPR